MSSVRTESVARRVKDRGYCETEELLVESTVCLLHVVDDVQLESGESDIPKEEKRGLELPNAKTSV